MGLVECQQQQQQQQLGGSEDQVSGKIESVIFQVNFSALRFVKLTGQLEAAVLQWSGEGQEGQEAQVGRQLATIEAVRKVVPERVANIGWGEGDDGDGEDAMAGGVEVRQRRLPVGTGGGAGGGMRSGAGVSRLWTCGSRGVVAISDGSRLFVLDIEADEEEEEVEDDDAEGGEDVDGQGGDTDGAEMDQDVAV